MKWCWMELILFYPGATIAIRYATVRRQGEVGPDGLERQTITYPSLYVRLIPLIARAYVFIELGRALVSILAGQWWLCFDCYIDARI
jgi:hypothetical protein